MSAHSVYCTLWAKQGTAIFTQIAISVYFLELPCNQYKWQERLSWGHDIRDYILLDHVMKPRNRLQFVLCISIVQKRNSFLILADNVLIFLCG